MKKNNFCGLMALLLLCALSTNFSAQPTQVLLETKAEKVINTSAIFEYSDITLSDPTIYRDEPFSISLTVKNTGAKEAKHELLLLLKDEETPKGQRKQDSRFLELCAGHTETVTFTFKATDLIEALENMPEVFVFSLGEFEIEVGYEK